VGDQDEEEVSVRKAGRNHRMREQPVQSGCKAETRRVCLNFEKQKRWGRKRRLERGLCRADNKVSALGEALLVWAVGEVGVRRKYGIGLDKWYSPKRSYRRPCVVEVDRDFSRTACSVA